MGGVFYYFIALVVVVGAVFFAVLLIFDFLGAGRAGGLSDVGIVLGVLAAVSLTAYIADRIRIRIHDRRILRKAAEMEMRAYYESPEWQQGYRSYLAAHPVKKISRGGTIPLLKRFFKFSGMNFRAAGCLTLIAAVYYFLVGSDGFSAVSLIPHIRNTFVVAVIFYGFIFFPVIFITTVPFKSWRKARRRKNARSLDSLEKLYEGAGYVSSGEALIVLGEREVLLCNLEGVMSVPWERIRGVSRVVRTYQTYLFERPGYPPVYSTGMEFETGICLTVAPGDFVSGDDFPQNWVAHELADYLRSQVKSGNTYAKEGFTLHFLFNEYQMVFLEAEIRKRIGQSEEESYVRRIYEAPGRRDFGNYNLSDYV